jgi:hypothetical protein
MSLPYISDQNEIANPFKTSTKGIRIVNNAKNHYGAIFHDVRGLENGGVCSTPRINSTNGTICESAGGMSFSAVNIFSLNFQNPDSSGDGVDFYSEPFGQETGTLQKGEGFYKVAKEEINPVYFKNTSDMGFWPDNYTFNTLPEYKQAYKSFQDRSGSVYIKGKYLVALYSGADDGWYCQTFSKTVPNLNAQQIISANKENQKINSVYIIPVK